MAGNVERVDAVAFVEEDDEEVCACVTPILRSETATTQIFSILSLCVMAIKIRNQDDHKRNIPIIIQLKRNKKYISLRPAGTTIEVSATL